MELTYHWEGDYLIPDLAPNSEPEGALTKYGMLRETFLKEQHSAIYKAKLTSGRLKAHLLQVQEQAEEMMEYLTVQMAKIDGVNEELKAADPMRWVAKMNNIRHSAEEVVLHDLIYTL